jgi:hypothetical protein
VDALRIMKAESAEEWENFLSRCFSEVDSTKSGIKVSPRHS